MNGQTNGDLAGQVLPGALLTVLLLPGTACERKNVEAVKILVQYKADTNHRCNRGWTALHESVARNDLEVMEILVGGGAKVESKNTYGITPFFVAAQSGQMEALRFLAKHGECQGSLAHGVPEGYIWEGPQRSALREGKFRCPLVDTL